MAELQAPVITFNIVNLAKMVKIQCTGMRLLTVPLLNQKLNCALWHNLSFSKYHRTYDLCLDVHITGRWGGRVRG